jgi:hypothetical protein
MRVMVRFKQSPNQKGKTRFAKFRLPPITAQPSLKSGGCYNLDCPDTGLDAALSSFMSLFDSGGGFLWDTGNAGGPGGNPAHNTKLVKQKRTVKGKAIDWPIAWTVKPWTGTSYGDIAKCPYLSHKGLNYFADEKKGKQAPYLKPGEAPKPDLGAHKKNSTLLAREFMNLLASKLTFNIKMTSNFRNAASNAAIMANTTFEHMTQGTGGLDQYRKSKSTYINLYNKAKKASGESNPKKGGSTYKILLSEIKKMFANKKTGHSVGGAVDISSRRLTRQQVSDVMYTCYYMGVTWVMLEHHIPHIHVSITADLKTFPKPADYNNPTKVKTLLEKFDKRYKSKAPATLPDMGGSAAVVPGIK